MGGVGRIVTQTGAELPSWDWEFERDNLREAWPYITPTWLRAAESAMTEGEPFHTIAHRLRNEDALLPGYIYTTPPDLDFDPRTYLGWQPAPDVQACCGGAELAQSAVDRVSALGIDAFFPALMLGSPLGYRTEAAFTFWTPELFRHLITASVQAAQERGVQCVVAPWIPDRMGNQHFIAALEQHGAAVGFRGTEDFLQLTAKDYADHVARMPSRKRRRLNLDRQAAVDAGVTFERLEKDELARNAARVAELLVMNRQRYGASARFEHNEIVLRQLLSQGVDVRCWVGRRGEEIVGVCLGFRKHDRIYIKSVGFDYAALGERSSVYFVLMFDLPVADAYAEGVRQVEFGMGSHEAKVVRGCESRNMSSAFIMTDPELRPEIAGLLQEYSAQRATMFGAEPVLAHS